VALVMVLLTTFAVTVIAGALSLLVFVDGRLMETHAARHAARGAAELALERAIQELASSNDWDALLAGTVASGLWAPDETVVLPFWGTLVLDTVTAALQAQSDATNVWGPNGPRWRLFARGPIDMFLGSEPRWGRVYLAVWISDDQSETDGNAWTDENGLLLVSAQAFGPGRTRQTVLATVRQRTHGVELVSWRIPGA
jgi:hypothetical protein